MKHYSPVFNISSGILIGAGLVGCMGPNASGWSAAIIGGVLVLIAGAVFDANA